MGKAMKVRETVGLINVIVCKTLLEIKITVKTSPNLPKQPKFTLFSLLYQKYVIFTVLHFQPVTAKP